MLSLVTMRRLALLVLLGMVGSAPRAAASEPERPAHAVVERLLLHRSELGLTEEQVAGLARLADGLRAERGTLLPHPEERIHGKPARRYVLKKTTEREALGHALRQLTPAQRPVAREIVLEHHGDAGGCRCD
jgi:hypothetical protein